jgi:phage terminase small subunit
MARGRKKLAALHFLEGNPSRRPLDATGIVAFGEPIVPEHLMDDARGCIEIIKRSMPPNSYSALDTFLLAAFGVAWTIHKRATLEMANADFAWITASETGMERPSAWIAIANQQVKVMAALAARLGLDPIARDSMAAGLPRQQRSAFDGLLAGQTVEKTNEPHS